MSLDGAARAAKGPGSLGIGQAAGHQGQHLQLVSGEAHHIVLLALDAGEVVPETLGQGGLDDRAPVHHLPDGVYQAGGRQALDQVTRGPGLDRLEDPVLVGEAGQDQYLGSTRLSQYAVEHLQAVDAGKLQVEQEQIWILLGDQLASVLSAVGPEA